MSMTFTEDEVTRIIGKKVDITAKFEEAHQHEGSWCANFSIDDDDSEEAVAYKLEHYANFVTAVTRNNVIDEQLSRMKKISGVVK